MSDLRKAISDLTPEQLELLQMRLKKLGEKKEVDPRFNIIRQPRLTNAFQLSLSQQRLWFLEQLDPGRATYNIPMAVRIAGPLNVPALEKCINRVIERHESLRTSFDSIDGRPLQIISPPAGGSQGRGVSASLPMIDLRGEEALARDERVRDISAREARTPFDLTRAPLLRTTLIRLEPGDHVLLITMHHLIADAWSIAILLKELTRLYESFHEARPLPLSELRIQYADYAQWQREWLNESRLQKQLDYWKQRLGDDLPIVALPTDRPYPEVQSYSGATKALTVSEELTHSLKSLAQAEKATLFIVLLTAFKALLFRYTGQRDLIVGTDLANRRHPETEELIGFFVNQLAIRSDLSGDPTFTDALARVREATLEAHSHQDVPFDQVVEAIKPDRNLSRSAVYQVMFALQNTPVEKLRVRDLTFTLLKTHTGTAKFDLILTMIDSGKNLIGEIEYNTDIFDPETIDRFATHYQTLLQWIVSEPSRRISELPILTQEERDQLVVGWNQTAKTGATVHSFIELFEAQVERSPNEVAVAYRDQRLTYSELNDRAGRLAALLSEEGVGPDTVVALLDERGIGLLIAILAVFKAGGAYLPLDPRHPKERYVKVLRQSRAPLILAGEGFRDMLSEAINGSDFDDPPAILPLDSPLAAMSTEGMSARRTSPSNLAYVIYTSGSTGEPKGAMVKQRGMINHLMAKVDDLGMTSSDCVAQTASQAFDISVWQFLAPLIVGGRVHIFEDAIAHDPSLLISEVERNSITLLEVVPSLLRPMIDGLSEGRVDRPSLSRLRWIIPTGEELPAALCRRWLELCEHVPIVNAYGPTECSDDVTHHKVFSAGQQQSERVPIGRPLSNVRLYVLDGEYQPAPIGVTGELYVAGSCVGRGYLNNPAETAESFLPDPFAPEQGSRFYKTGDLARRLKDGVIEFMGRADKQVKVRGNRIELGELEEVLRRHAAVKDAVAVVRDEPGVPGRLVAYVVADPHYRDDNSNNKQISLDGERSDWELVWNDTFGDAIGSNSPDRAIVGWKSSYTGTDLPTEEVRDWVKRTVERILSLRPRNVLEIGCGLGLLLSEIAPHSEQYWATDFSDSALNYVTHIISTNGSRLNNVRLLKREGDDFEGIEADSFDVAILNSVSQYFPSLQYLMRVIEGAVEAIRPGGFFFIGDVRSYPLLEAFHSSVQIYQAQPDASLAQLRQRVLKQMAQDKELVVAPDFFLAFKKHLPKISRAAVQIKRGWPRNEMSLFRYDVALQIGEGPEPVSDPDLFDWQRDKITTDSLRDLLGSTRREAVVIKRIPNARLWEHVKAWELLSQPGPLKNLGELHEALAETALSETVEPEAVWEIGDDLQLDVSLGYSGDGADGCFDAVFRRRLPDATASAVWDTPFFGSEPAVHTRWDEYANNPEKSKQNRLLASTLRAYLEEKLPEYMVPSAFVVLDSMPLTLNGKIDRKNLPAPDTVERELLKEYVPPRTVIETRLARIWGEVLRIEQVGIHDNYFELGGDSILSIQIVARARQEGLEITPRQMFQHQSVAALASVAQSTRNASADQGLVTGPVALTPIQRWFFEQRLANVNHYNQSLLLEIRDTLEPDIMRAVVEKIMEHHDALRMRFHPDDRGWGQVCVEPGGYAPFTALDLSELSDIQKRGAIEAAAGQVQEGLDIARGPVIRFVLANLGADRPGRLLITAHHLVMDAVSWAILLEDLLAAYEQLRAGKQIRLPRKTTSYKAWSERLTAFARSPEIQEEAPFWLGQFESALIRLPVDYPGGVNTYSSARTYSASLERDETQALLHEVPAAYKTQINDALLLALAQSVSDTAGPGELIVDVEVHGREEIFEDVDLSRTVGWFSAIFPVSLVVEKDVSPGQAIREVKGKLRSVKNGGIGYGALRYLASESEDAEKLRRAPRAEVTFNYFGQIDNLLPESSPFAPAKESNGPSFDPDGLRSHLIELNVDVTGGCLRCHWIYSENVHRRITIERMADSFLATLRTLIKGDESSVKAAYAPSDFAAARLDQEDLDRFLARISEADQAE